MRPEAWPPKILGKFATDRHLFRSDFCAQEDAREYDLQKSIFRKFIAKKTTLLVVEFVAIAP